MGDALPLQSAKQGLRQFGPIGEVVNRGRFFFGTGRCGRGDRDNRTEDLSALRQIHFPAGGVAGRWAPISGSFPPIRQQDHLFRESGVVALRLQATDPCVIPIASTQHDGIFRHVRDQLPGGHAGNRRFDVLAPTPQAVAVIGTVWRYGRLLQIIGDDLERDQLLA